MAITKEAVSDVPAFDTRKYVRTLTRGGFSDQQANASTDGLQEALRGVAMKSDIDVLRAEMKAEIKSVKVEIKSVKAEMKAEIKEIRTEIGGIKMILAAHQEQMQGLRQMMAIGFSINGGLTLLLGLLFTVATFFG